MLRVKNENSENGERDLSRETFRRENQQTLKFTFVHWTGGKGKITSRYQIWAIGWTVGLLTERVNIRGNSDCVYSGTC